MDNMEGPKSLIMVRLPTPTRDTILALIQNFFDRLSAEQWTELRAGSSDDATKILLVELLLDIIISISKELLRAFRSIQNISEEHVLSSLGDTLPQSFADVLRIDDDIPCESSEHLSELIAKEVAEKFNSALPTSSHNTNRSGGIQHITSPSRLNAMLCHLRAMLKAFMAKMKMCCKPKPCRRRKSPETSKEELKDKEESSGSKTDSGVLIDFESGGSAGETTSSSSGIFSTKSPLKKPTTETPEKISSGGSSDKETVIQDIITKEASQIVEPLLDDLSDDEFELLQSKSSQEIEAVAEEIAAIVEKAESSKESDIAGSSLKPNEKNKMSTKEVCLKIKTFLGKYFAKAWIYRLVTQLKKKFHKNAKVESRETIQSLIAEVDALLLTEDGKEPQKFETMSRVKAFKFTEELNEFLFHHVVESMPPITPEKSTERSGRPSSVPLSRATACFEIENKAWSFPGLMRWWIITQSGSHSQRLTRTIMDPEAEAPMELITILYTVVGVGCHFHNPTRYDECVGPGSAQIYIPTDDPPPYSLLDPCQRGPEQEEHHTAPDPSPYCGETSASAAWFSPSHYPLGLQEQEHQHIASISFPLEAAPPYESVLAEQGQPLPLMPCDLYKHQSETGDDGNSRQPGANQIL
ncbi:hypothetical protein L3Q82_001846 [Scortum barcoo]|uniref:Uncharacterized protein n=1 Tax=Scortum barcoo TaxID=214431 RepID=A0ACB8W583_9TELE|nr:hypothetical protein L3Q82_001846 [Scortum barcoo]